jgi:hypothetical protein
MGTTKTNWRHSDRLIRCLIPGQNTSTLYAMHVSRSTRSALGPLRHDCSLVKTPPIERCLTAQTTLPNLTSKTTPINQIDHTIQTCPRTLRLQRRNLRLDARFSFNLLQLRLLQSLATGQPRLEIVDGLELELYQLKFSSPAREHPWNPPFSSGF